MVFVHVLWCSSLAQCSVHAVQVRSALHVFGHTHTNTDVTMGAAAGNRRYVQYAWEGLNNGSSSGHSRPCLYCIWDGHTVCGQEVDAS